MKLENNEKKVKTTLVLIILAALSALLFIQQTEAQPTGLEILTNYTDVIDTPAAGLRNDSGGTINILTVTAAQQNSRWKAYVGNISGTLALDDSSGRSIFRWELGAEDTTGNIFISRSNTVDWGTSSLQCANETHIINEDTAMGFSSTAADSINRTFDEQRTIVVDLVTYSNCPATSTFVENNKQAGTPYFPLLLLESNGNMIYGTPINKSTQSFSQTGTLVDFQAIVPNEVGSTTPYYFYAEIGI